VHNAESQRQSKALSELLLALHEVGAFNPSAPRADAISRRAMLGAALGTAVASALPVLPASAVKPCPAGANNCFSSQSSGKNAAGPWTWPSGTSKADAVAQLTAAVNEYPQQGQSDVDKGGWALVDDQFSSGYARYEFKSGLGNFAKFFNGGKPFIDDLEFSIGDSSVDVRSSSRVGDSDFGVNAKRLNFIADKLRAKGWTAASIAV